ncbi:DUF1877 family protein [Actinomadura rugatobispora]|uniref:DUF1877 family protein n=1 Tax=Actinomadura rugatobispora TaxID=1994 RepID=A0ABW1A8Y4_9ACTN|nr:hypothetical protein GCM10010200_048040 [Actinomadura rugatobispora]
MSLGVHFALDQEQEGLVLGAADDEELAAVIEEIEENSDSYWHMPSDKAWDAIHRCLAAVDRPGADLSLVVLGGRDLYEGADYFVAHVTAEEVRALAQVLPSLDRELLHRLFFAMDVDDYYGPHDEQDFDYTWENFEDVRAFFTRAAEAGRAVVFTVDA